MTKWVRNGIGIAVLILRFGFLDPSTVLGQVATGTIVGTVADGSGAIIPGSTVTATNTDTGLTSSTVADDRGFFTLPGLQAGHYKVSAAAKGFATDETPAITLDAGVQRQVTFSMKPGTVGQTIVVTDAAPPIDLVTATVQPVVEQATIVGLPLNLRDWTQFTELQPGVSPTRTQPPIGLSNQRANRGLGNQISIAGSRPQQNNYRLDGISINDYSNGAPGGVIGAVLGVDAIEEFSVVTSSAEADQGKTSGGVVNAITQSGGNKWHGEAYDFFRNSALDARNEFDSPNHIAPFHRNQFGGALGGPIKKEKTFIFGDYEGLRQSQAANASSIVPSPNARMGILANGQTITVDPAAAKFLTFYPLPNAGISGTNPDVGTFIFNQPTAAKENFFTVRADQVLGVNDKLSGTYFYDNGHLTSPDSFDVRNTENIAKRQMGAITETHTFSPSLLNSLRVGYSRVTSIAPTTLSAINPAAADLSYGFITGRYAGLINIGGLTNFQGGLGGTGQYNFNYDSYQIYDDLYWTRGLHSIKIGFSFERLQNNQLGTSNPNGQYAFGSLESYLLNEPSAFNAPLATGISPRDLRQSVFGAYISDDYKILPNLTLNLGLRYEPTSVPTETAGRLSLLPSLTATAPHLGSPYFDNPTYTNFSPRFGFAWDPGSTGKTSVRGGIGLYDSLPLDYIFEGLSILTAPYLELGSLGAPPAGSFPTGAYSLLTPAAFRYSYFPNNPPRSYVEQYNLNVQRLLPGDLTLTVGYVGSHGVHLPFRDDDINTTQPISTDGGYYFYNPKLCQNNMCTPNNPPSPKLNPALGQISSVILRGQSNYNALTLLVNKRLSHYTQAQVSYTWAKSLDNGSSSTFGDTFNNSISSPPIWAPGREYGPSDFNIGQNFVANFLLTTPENHSDNDLVRFVANGWQWNAVFSANTGQPFTPLISGDPMGLSSADTFGIADRLEGPGCKGNPVNSRSKTFVKANCFAYPAYNNVTGVTRLGDAGRNSIVGPGLQDFDSAFIKDNKIHAGAEQLNVQFRAEFFNLFNRVNYLTPPKAQQQLFAPPAAWKTGNPAPTPTAQGGQLVGPTATSSRQLQFAMKVQF